MTPVAMKASRDVQILALSAAVLSSELEKFAAGEGSEWRRICTLSRSVRSRIEALESEPWKLDRVPVDAVESGYCETCRRVTEWSHGECHGHRKGGAL